MNQPSASLSGEYTTSYTIHSILARLLPLSFHYVFTPSLLLRTCTSPATYPQCASIAETFFPRTFFLIRYAFQYRVDVDTEYIYKCTTPNHANRT
jgi:hypothetical protein